MLPWNMLILQFQRWANCTNGKCWDFTETGQIQMGNTGACSSTVRARLPREYHRNEQFTWSSTRCDFSLFILNGLKLHRTKGSACATFGNSLQPYCIVLLYHAIWCRQTLHLHTGCRSQLQCVFNAVQEMDFPHQVLV